MKTTFYLPVLLSLVCCTSLFSQSNIQQSVSVNSSGSAADASAQLDVSATDKGMLVPRMTTAQRTAIASPATGLLVFDTTTGGFWFYNGTVWADLSAPKTLADADSDTKIQVEKNPDEDIIRFDLAGTESMVLQKNADGSPRLELPNDLNNTFLGTNAGLANTTGFANAAFGRAALFSNTTGSTNTATGRSALLYNTTGHDNTANGNSALQTNTTGSFNTANGKFALFSNWTGNGNTATGSYALAVNNSGSNNTALGYQADVTTGALTNATAIGYNAKVGASNSLVLGGTGADAVNVGVGTTTPNASALLDLTSTNRGMLVPRMTSAQRTAIASPATGLLVFDMDTGSFWFYSGSWKNLSAAPAALADADNDTKIQVEESPDEDIIRFDLAGTESMVLRKNANGHSRLELTDGFNNTFVGSGSGSSNVNNSGNTAFGANTLTFNLTGSSNTATGFNSLFFNTGGSQNTANGNFALSNNTTGNNNTGLGNSTDVSSGTLNNATAIGHNTTANASDKVRIGNSSVSVIEGQVPYTFPSDARFKFNIHDDQVPGLAFINQLRPVTYQFDTRKFDEHLMQNMPDSVQQRRMAGQDYTESTALVQTGFLAQEVEAVCKDLDFTFSGLHVPTSEVDNYGLAYGSFVPLLVKAVQEQQKIIENSLSREIGRELKMENLAAENAALKAQLDKITSALAGAGIGVEK